MSVLDALITDRTQADVDAGASKGVYSAMDLNRVGEAANYIRDMLAEYGYAVPDALRTDWTITDIPRQSDMDAYISTLLRLRDTLRPVSTVPALPLTMEKFTFISANQIEAMLLWLGRPVENIPDGWFFSGQIEGGVAYA